MPQYPAEIEVKSNGTHGALTLLGEALSYNLDGSINYGPLQTTFLSDTAPLPLLIPPPFLTGSQSSRTTIDLQWAPTSPPPGTPPVLSWVVQRRSSTDNGTTFSPFAAISGSPFAAATLTASQTGLSTGTPEVVFQYRVAGVNADTDGPQTNLQWSNIIALQWQGSPVAPPSAPTAFTNGTMFATHVSFVWSETSDSTVTKHGLYQGGSLVVDNIDKSATSYNWTGLVAGSTHNNVRIARANLGPGGVVQWSPLSNSLSFTLPVTDPPTFTMLMGCSDSNKDHGGTLNWDGWRCYDRAGLYDAMTRPGCKYIAYSVNGQPLGSGDPGDPVSAMTYTAIFNYCKAELDALYYVGGANSQTHSARWGIKLFWSNGNENMDKGLLSLPHTTAGINNFVTSMHALYDACHFIDPTTGQRRFPDAYAGDDPTHNAEKKGIVADYLHPSARYHDFVMWSMYPPGRNQAQDPIYNWPTFDSTQALTNPQGFLIRCYERTYQAQAQARLDTGNPNFNLMVCCAEVGIGSAGPTSGNDSTLRPYYAVHALAGGMYKLAQQYGFVQPFATWWDNDIGVPNTLSDEPAGTNPSTRVAWQNWLTYNHQFGGTHPATWAGNPKSTWRTTGTVV